MLRTFSYVTSLGLHLLIICARMLAGYAVKLASIVALYAYMYLENKRRDREAIDGQEVEAEGVENGMLVSFVTERSTAQAN
jgi:hypothetical protein